MRVLQNFTIRLVMLVILGIFCLMWSGVGLYSVFSLSKVADGNEIDRQLVNQMTLLSQGNDQYFRVVTRLSRVLETKAAGGSADFNQVQLALDNMKTKLEALKAISPGPMDEKISAQAIASWQTLLDQGGNTAGSTGAAGRPGRLSPTGKQRDPCAEPRIWCGGRGL